MEENASSFNSHAIGTFLINVILSEVFSKQYVSLKKKCIFSIDYSYIKRPTRAQIPYSGRLNNTLIRCTVGLDQILWELFKLGQYLYTGHYPKMEEYVSLQIFSHPRPPLCCFSVNNT